MCSGCSKLSNQTWLDQAPPSFEQRKYKIVRREHKGSLCLQARSAGVKLHNWLMGLFNFDLMLPGVKVEFCL